MTTYDVLVPIKANEKRATVQAAYMVISTKCCGVR